MPSHIFRHGQKLLDNISNSNVRLPMTAFFERLTVSLSRTTRPYRYTQTIMSESKTAGGSRAINCHFNSNICAKCNLLRMTHGYYIYMDVDLPFSSYSSLVVSHIRSENNKITRRATENISAALITSSVKLLFFANP